MCNLLLNARKTCHLTWRKFKGTINVSKIVFTVYCARKSAILADISPRNKTANTAGYGAIKVARYFLKQVIFVAMQKIPAAWWSCNSRSHRVLQFVGTFLNFFSAWFTRIRVSPYKRFCYDALFSYWGRHETNRHISGRNHQSIVIFRSLFIVLKYDCVFIFHNYSCQIMERCAVRLTSVIRMDSRMSK